MLLTETYAEGVHRPRDTVTRKTKEATDVVAENGRGEVATAEAIVNNRARNSSQKTHLILRAVWKISSSCCASCSGVSLYTAGSFQRPRSLILSKMFAAYYNPVRQRTSTSIESHTHVVVPTENDEQCARGGRDEDKAILRKRIVPEQSTTLSLVTYEVLFGLVRSIQRRQVDVARRVVDRVVRGVRAEERVRHKRSERERQCRVAARVRHELPQ